MNIITLSMIIIFWIKRCYSADVIYTSIGIIDSSPHHSDKNNTVIKGYNSDLHLRKKRSIENAFSSSELQDILDKHNELRSAVSPEAANMKFMEWNDNLAILAQEYSEECIWGHGKPNSNTTTIFGDEYGQNLWLGSTRPTGPGQVQAWYNEVQYYTFSTIHCESGKECGHYRQVVWATSYSLGCGAAFCKHAVGDNNNKTNVWIMTCHYGEQGNYVGEHPYIEGGSCTKCSSGSGQCYNNQCRSCDEHNEKCVCNQQCQNCGVLNTTSCRCNCHQSYAIEPDCSVFCTDNHASCGNGWYTAQCATKYFVLDGCPHMCGVCDPNQDDFECGETAVATQPSTNSPSQMEQTHVSENPEQVQNGVKMTITASITVWSSILSSFLNSIKRAVNGYCNDVDNFEACCPNSGIRNSTQNKTFITQEDVKIADGYPQEIDENSFSTMVYVTPKEDNDLCMSSSTSDETRKRRYITEFLTRRFKRDITIIYFDQDVLYIVIITNEEIIEAGIGYSIVDVEKGQIIIVQEDDDEIRLEVIIGIVIAAVAFICIIVGVIYCVSQTNRPTNVGSSNNQNE